MESENGFEEHPPEEPNEVQVGTGVVKYPDVLNEFVTLDALHTGKSIARYGDGELKMIHGGSYIREDPNPSAAAELYEVLTEPVAECIVGIPTMDEKGPKIESWLRHKDRFCGVLSPHVTYYSSFITRPDSAPWIENHHFAREMEDLWRGKVVTLVGEKSSKLLGVVRLAAKSVRHVECARHGAYRQIRDLEREVFKKAIPQVVILSCGITATCLANRLAPKVQTLDLGSVGGFLQRQLYPSNKIKGPKK
jgi:hypothetical protein